MAALRLPANINNGIPNIILDEQLRIYSVNAQAQTLIGHTDSDLHNVKIRKIIPNWPTESIHQEMPGFLERVSVVARERIKLCNLSIAKSPLSPEVEGGVLLVSIFPLEDEGVHVSVHPSPPPAAALSEELRIFEDALGPLLKELGEHGRRTSFDPHLLLKIEGTYEGIRNLMRLDRGLPIILPKAAPAIVVSDTIRISRGTILVVDDNSVNRFILTRLLTTLGFDIEQAENGQEAIAKVKEKAFSCIFLDINMPILDGRKACRLIRQHANGAAIPIIMHSTEEDVLPEEMGAHAFTDRLDKPVIRQNLIEILDRYIPPKDSQKGQEDGPTKGGGRLGTNLRARFRKISRYITRSGLEPSLVIGC